MYGRTMYGCMDTDATLYRVSAYHPHHIKHSGQGAPRPGGYADMSVVPERPIIAASRKTEESIQVRYERTPRHCPNASVVGNLHPTESFTIHRIRPPKFPEFLQLRQFYCSHATFFWFGYLRGVLDTGVPSFERNNDRRAVILCSQFLCESHNLPCSNLWTQFGTGSNQICDLWV